MSTSPTKRAPSQDERLPAPNLPTHLLDVIQTIWRWRMPIIYTTLAAGLGSIVISLLLPEYFTAETRFLAISPDQSAPETIFGNSGSRPQLYGNMNDIDRLLAIAESNEMVDFLVDSFDLYQHYEIDPTKAKASVLVRKKFFGHYEVTKTPRDAIMIEVEDENPEMAAALANAARNHIDYLSKKIITDAQWENVKALRSEVKAKTQRMVAIGDSIESLRRTYGIFDINTQQEVLSTELTSLEKNEASTRAKIAAYRSQNSRGARDSIAKLEISLAGIKQSKIILDSQLVKLNNGMSPILDLLDLRGGLSRGLNGATDRLKQYEAAMVSTQPSIALLEVATVPVIKSRPKRMFIVLGATIVVFIFAILGALLIENARRYRWEDILK